MRQTDDALSRAGDPAGSAVAAGAVRLGDRGAPLPDGEQIVSVVVPDGKFAILRKREARNGLPVHGDGDRRSLCVGKQEQERSAGEQAGDEQKIRRKAARGLSFRFAPLPSFFV